MSLTVEELLRPRYKVMADWPDSQGARIGAIITIENGSGFLQTNKEWNWKEETLVRYPHLFERLQWWHERAETDLPKYVRNTADNIVFEVEYNFSGNTPSDVHTRTKGTKWFWHSLYDLLPATLEEYNCSISSTKQSNNG